MRILGSKVGPDGIIIGELLGVVARLLGDPGEDQIENLPAGELRLWSESWLGEGWSPWSGVTGRYWYGLREGMTSGLVVMLDCLPKGVADCLGDA